MGSIIQYQARSTRIELTTLTDAGKIFYERAQQLCSIEESTYNAVQQLNSRIEGTLSIATSASRSTPIVQQYLPAFFHEISISSL